MELIHFASQVQVSQLADVFSKLEQPDEKKEPVWTTPKWIWVMLEHATK